MWSRAGCRALVVVNRARVASRTWASQRAVASRVRPASTASLVGPQEAHIPGIGRPSTEAGCLPECSPKQCARSSPSDGAPSGEPFVCSKRARDSVGVDAAEACLAAAVDREDSHVDAEDVPKPEAYQLRQLFVRTAVPFVGFGFFDNMIMLTVGETIDLTFGATFGFSTMAAAGMGQMASDGCGITLQGLIERFADSLGLPHPHLTRQQRRLNYVQALLIFSRIFGVVFGCFLGMFPLLFLPPRELRLVDQICEKLPPQTRMEFRQKATTVRCPEGSKLLSVGEMTTHVFILQSGELDVVGRDFEDKPFLVCTLGPDSTFGQPEEVYSARVDLVAKGGEAVALSIDKVEFLRITGSHGAKVFEQARGAEHKVYLASQGASLTQTDGLRAERGTGKTRFFAKLTPEEKMQVLKYTGRPDSQRFRGGEDEGKTSYFAQLPEEVKKNALVEFQKRKFQQAFEKQNSYAAVFAEPNKA